MAAQLARNSELGRHFDFSQKVDDAVRSLSIADVNAAWRKYIDPDRAVLAWGGDFKAAP